VIDLGRQQVTKRGAPVHLTPTEFALLRELVTNRRKLLSHAHLLRRVWGHATRPRPSTSACTYGDCEPSWRATTRAVDRDAPRAGYRFVGPSMAVNDLFRLQGGLTPLSRRQT